MKLGDHDPTLPRPRLPRFFRLAEHQTKAAHVSASATTLIPVEEVASVKLMAHLPERLRADLVVIVIILVLSIILAAEPYPALGSADTSIAIAPSAIGATAPIPFITLLHTLSSPD